MTAPKPSKSASRAAKTATESRKKPSAAEEVNAPDDLAVNDAAMRESASTHRFGRVTLSMASNEDVGTKYGADMQDHHVILHAPDKPAVQVVADGMGGKGGGGTASRIIAETFRELYEQLPCGADHEQIEEWLKSSIQEAQNRIHEQQLSAEDMKDMGSTVIAAAVDRSGLLHACWVGDSRLYLLRDGEFETNQFGQPYLSRDHSEVQHLVERGLLTEEQAFEHPRKNIITEALGYKADPRYLDPSVILYTGDRLLLCCDGINDNLTADQIRDAIASTNPAAKTPARAAANLLEQVKFANSGPRLDNLTAIVFDVQLAE